MRIHQVLALITSHLTKNHWLIRGIAAWVQVNYLIAYIKGDHKCHLLGRNEIEGIVKERRYLAQVHMEVMILMRDLATRWEKVNARI